METEVRPLISRRIFKVVATGADMDSLATLGETSPARFRARWQELIDHKLLEWLRDPSQLDDEGMDQPSGTILRLAIDLAEKFRDDGLAPPDRIVPDPNGGIVFERRRNDLFEVIHIWEDGTEEYQQFRGTSLIERTPL